MLNIALEDDGRAMSIVDISEREGISATYLEQLLNKLRHSGLVESVRGPKGGYTLSRKPGEITVGDIVKTLEGDISPVHCATIQKRSRNACKNSSSCVPKVVWAKLAKSIDDCLESITLKDLCLEAKKIAKS